MKACLFNKYDGSMRHGIICTPRLRYIAILLWLLLAACASARAQQTPLLLGTIESNYINWEQDKNNPYFAAVHFVKNNGRWQTADTGLQNNMLFSVFFKGKRLKQLHGVADSTMELMGGLDNCYRIPRKQVPITGKKSRRYSGWAGEPVYRQQRPL
jgi:hypothetical protein